MSEWPPALTEAVVAEAAGWPIGACGQAPVEPPWRSWYARALAEGIDDALAALGRALMHEACTRPWGDDARAAAGLFDDGDAMLELASTDPELAERSWSALLEHDGCVPASFPAQD